MTRFFSENNLPALLKRLDARLDQKQDKGTAAGGDIVVPTKLSELQNDLGFQTDAIEKIKYGETELTKVSKEVDLKTAIDGISIEELEELYQSI